MQNAAFAANSGLFLFSEAQTSTNPKIIWSRHPIKCMRWDQWAYKKLTRTVNVPHKLFTRNEDTRNGSDYQIKFNRSQQTWTVFCWLNTENTNSWNFLQKHL